jgi:long-chain fatty acid transport protein
MAYAWKTADDRFALGVSAILAAQLFEAKGVKAFGPYTKSFVDSGFTQQPKNLSNNGHDTAYGYGGSVGGIWNINKMFSLAAAYTTKISMSKFSDYSDLFAENGGMDVPSTATYGLTVRPVESLSLSFDYQDIWYSDTASVNNPIQNLYQIDSQGVNIGCPSLGGNNPQACLGGNKGGGFGWEDMSVYKFGLAWKYDPTLTFRAGYAVADSQPIPKDQMTFNILAPGVIEQHITAGFTKEFANGNQWNFAASYAPEKKVKGPNNFDPTQTVELSMYQFEFEMSYSWRR